MWSAADIDQSVLRILNRLIFLRTAEDREVEPRRLEPLVRELGDARKLNELPRRLAALFRDMDAIYDSELFAPHLSETLDCEPAPFERLIKGLYERNYTRYNFNAIDADVLGTVYEQYLGHVVAEPPSELTRRSKKPSQARLLGGDALTVVEKRQKRKSQGIYYTPTFVVKYIVQNTLGRYLQEHDYHPARPVRVLDMACGSGSFLIEAFDALDRHVAQMRGQERATHPLREGASHVFDHARAVEILAQCLYGVDKDKQAVEVARLNLMLRGLHSRDKLPHLDNLRVGDSLISGPPEELQAAFGKDWKAKAPFNWKQEFPEVFTPTPAFGSPSPDAQRRERGPGGEGGFDVIVGNPPYVRIQTLPKDEVAFFNEHYQAATGNYDIYVLFVERAWQLLKPGGMMGFILPNKFMQAGYGEGLRTLITEANALWKIVDFGDAQIFGEATTYTCLLFLQKQPNTEALYVPAASWLKTQAIVPQIMPDDLPEHQIQAATLTGEAWHFAVGASAPLLERLRTMPVKLEHVTSRIFQGIKTSADKIYIVEELQRKAGQVLVYSEAKDKKYWLERDLLHPLIKGGDSKRYHLSRTKRLILFPYAKQENGITDLISASRLRNDYPLVWAYLKDNKSYLENRESGKMRGLRWYGYVYPKALDVMPLPKIFTPDIAPRASFSVDDTGEVFFTGGVAGGYGILVLPDCSREYILALLNSQLLDWFIHQTSSKMRGGWFSYEARFIRTLPIRRINFDDPAEKAQHDHIVRLVTEMLELHKERADAERALDDRRHRLARRIEELDKAIDAAVYKLYGLTEDEIRVVEDK